MKNYNSFDLINKLSFERVSCSSNEYRACELISSECEKVGLSTTRESFVVDTFELKRSELSFNNGAFKPLVVGGGFSGSTSEDGIEAELAYITSYNDACIQNISHKICLIHSRIIEPKLFNKFIECKIAGLIICYGTLKDETIPTIPNLYRASKYDYSSFPVVYITMKDANIIVQEGFKNVHLVSVQEHIQKQSNNVVAEIVGVEHPEEIIVFTAHYDTTPYSVGAYDNASGCASLYYLANYFKDNPPKRTIRFIWCGSEENGLLGSKAYVESHKDELERIKLCINIDMIGVTIGFDHANVIAEKALADYINYMGMEEGFAIESTQSIYSSDSSSFADKGVPAVSFARSAPSGGAEIHCKDDVVEVLSEKNFYNTCNFIAKFATRMANATVFPVSRKIPDNMLEELDYYFYRKEKVDKA